MSSLNVLEARGLGKRYGDNWALSNCTFGLPSGRVVGLAGPNGAGQDDAVPSGGGRARAERGRDRRLRA